VQAPLGDATLAPVRLMLVEPAVAVAVPPQLFVSPLGVATTKPVGSVSENATAVSVTVFAAGLPTVNVSVVVPFTAIVAGLKDLASEGGATTPRLAEAVPPVPPSVEVTRLVVLFCGPAEIPATFTEKLQELLAASVAPVKPRELLPAVAVIVPPPQLPVSPFGVEIASPAGKVSVKPTPERLCVVLLF